MIIGIDGNEANVSERSVGIHQYAFEILWAFYRINKTSKNRNTFVIYLSKPHISELPPPDKQWRYEILRGNRLWILLTLTPRLIFKEKIDVFFSPSHYLPLFTGVPMVCTIHDLGYLVFTEQFKKYDFWQLKYWTAISIIVSKYIISVSQSTTKDIVRHYKIASKKIHTVHHGYDKTKFNIDLSDDVVRQLKKRYKITKNYILFLSLLKPSKNLEGILAAFENIIKNPRYKTLQLVIAGRKGWMFDQIFRKVQERKLSKNVIFTGFVNEVDKPYLIKGAYLIVSPSFWEGFGMHVLEALACGTPAVVSKVASLPEVAGKVGVYVDPLNSLSIKEGIESVLQMESREYTKLQKACLSQAAKFSWEKAGKETLAAIIKAAK